MAQADAERGDRIKWLREEKLHLTQEGMADKVGVTLRGYQEWEAGGGIKWDNAKKLAKAGGVTPDWIMSGDNNARTPDLSNGQETQLDRVEQRLEAIEASLATIQVETATRYAELLESIRLLLQPVVGQATQKRNRKGS